MLLLDEPFGALDAKVRQELRQWLRRLHDEIHVTSIFVTHDQEEAFEVADRVVVMNHARIEQIGTPQEVYNHPATAFVYQFLGNVTTFRGTVRDEWFQLGDTSVYLPVRDEVRNGAAIACVRHHDVKVHLEPSDVAPIAARITHVNAAGSIVRVELERLDDKSRIAAELPQGERCAGAASGHARVRRVAQRARFSRRRSARSGLRPACRSLPRSEGAETA